MLLDHVQLLFVIVQQLLRELGRLERHELRTKQNKTNQTQIVNNESVLKKAEYVS